MPFGSFIDVLPPTVFLVIHSAAALIGLACWRRAGRAANAGAARGFLLYVTGELVYIVYHFDLLTFLFAHTVAETLDLLAVISLGLALRPRAS